MKFLKSDGLKIKYCGIDCYVLESVEHSRGGTLSPHTTEYVLEDGTRVLPVHFRYNYAKIIGDGFKWYLKSTYPPSVISSLSRQSNKFLKSVAKDPNWSGVKLIVPFSNA